MRTESTQILAALCIQTYVGIHISFYSLVPYSDFFLEGKAKYTEACNCRRVSKSFVTDDPVRIQPCTDRFFITDIANSVQLKKLHVVLFVFWYIFNFLLFFNNYTYKLCYINYFINIFKKKNKNLTYVILKVHSFGVPVKQVPTKFVSEQFWSDGACPPSKKKQQTFQELKF